jgi:hypothetical protein
MAEKGCCLTQRCDTIHLKCAVGTKKKTKADSPYNPSPVEDLNIEPPKCEADCQPPHRKVRLVTAVCSALIKATDKNTRREGVQRDVSFNVLTAT